MASRWRAPLLLACQRCNTRQANMWRRSCNRGGRRVYGMPALNSVNILLTTVYAKPVPRLETKKCSARRKSFCLRRAYLKMLYKYPQREFPYGRLMEENRRRGKDQPEFELLDTGIFDDDRYFDVFVEYAKADAEDILMLVTVHN